MPRGVRLNPEHDQRTRAKIQTSQIINRLQSFVNGDVKLEPAQVTAALGLLKKTLPDLTASENKTELVHRYVARVPEKAKSSTEWKQSYSPDHRLIQ